MNLDELINTINNAPRIYEKPEARADLRRESIDFDVTEVLSFEPSGEGEHLFLYIEKQDINTDFVSKQLQKLTGLRSQDIGYAGKKDRYSISRQWFSLHLPGQPDDVALEKLNALSEFNCRILETRRHNKKLRTGAVKNNRFKIRLSNFSGELNSSSLTNIAKHGVPNYFGYQRFGHNYNNIYAADRMLKGEMRVKSRNKRGLYLSAARSFLFNLQLAERINQGNWLKLLPGDCLMLNNSRSFFTCDSVSDEDVDRFNQGDLNTSGVLIGRQVSQAQGEMLELEQQVLQPFEPWAEGLIKARVDTDRRSFRVIPEAFSVEQESPMSLLVSFQLPAGCFATSVLRELVQFTDVRQMRNEDD